MKRDRNKTTLAAKQARGEPREVVVALKKSPPPIVAKNEFQKLVVKALVNKQIVVALGAAGTGKSYLTMGMASDWFMKGEIDKIILTRPAVGMGNTLGLLKGSLEEKFNPYLAPLIEVFKDRHGIGAYETALRAGNIEMLPVEYMRGRNIRDVAILDEAQNVTKDEMFSIITRVTDGGKLFIIGDPNQTDLKQESGLTWLFNFVQTHKLENHIELIKATSEDIVRGGLCKAFVQAMEQEKAYAQAY